jgi:hypothetical protein
MVNGIKTTIYLESHTEHQKQSSSLVLTTNRSHLEAVRWWQAVFLKPSTTNPANNVPKRRLFSYHPTQKKQIQNEYVGQYQCTIQTKKQSDYPANTDSINKLQIKIETK